MKTKLTAVTYLGFTSMERGYSNAMLPWLIKEIRTSGVHDKLSIALEDGCLKAYNGNFEPVLVHRLVDIFRASQVPGHPEELFYILLDERAGLLHCYLYRAASGDEVSELFTQMREPSPGFVSPRGSAGALAVTKNAAFQRPGADPPWAAPGAPGAPNTQLTTEAQTGLERTVSNASSALISLCADLSPSDSHFFEVLYIGKVRISQRKVPESLIDDALHKFAQHEAEKERSLTHRRHSMLSSTGTSIYSNDSTETVDKTDQPDFTTRKYNITASNTPLEPDKTTTWKSVDNVNNSVKDKKDNIKDNRVTERPNDVDDEFDTFTKERVEINAKKPSQIPLEPNILILNVPKTNLGTVAEEKSEEIHSIIKETASSITQFCTSNTYNDLDDSSLAKDVKADISKHTNENLNIQESQSDPVMKATVDKEKADLPDKIQKKDLKLNLVKEDSIEREDSPAPVFHEIPRKPVGIVSERRNSPMPENKPFLRDRSASIGTLNLKTPIAQFIGEQNRTMLFQVGRSELRLISPDRKQILLHRAFKDVASCVLGRVNKEHFGFVCRETANDSYACYVFKCESDSVSTEVINAIKQAFVAHSELIKKSREKSPNLSCEHCPMLWYHRLCHDVEGMNEKRTHAFILRRIEQLPEEEQELLITKYRGGTHHMYEVSEHNAFLMMLLRAHCEARQLRHVHDTAENRSEFLNQYLGGSTIFMKAKRSLSSGFDHLLKRRASKDDSISFGKKEASPLPTPTSESDPSGQLELLSPDTTRRKSVSPAVTANGSSVDGGPSPYVASTMEEETEDVKEEVGTPVNSPMMDIFLKVSDNRPTVTEPGTEPEATWRQAIYEKVVDVQEGDLTPKALLGLPTARPGKRTRDELRRLWKLAIDQTILLGRMEKENARLRQSEESSAVRRIKLEYVELGSCDAGAAAMWDALLAARDRQQPAASVDRHMLTQAVRQGVPRMSRGAVWYFLAEQRCAMSAPPDVSRHPLYHAPYAALLGGLTKHQHAILIDLGRTFPKHSYFASALGPGQLALYNILKAYSLLDPEVGYCQGLSFVAGVLLLHMDEAEAFVLLRHLMFRRGLRNQYLPDMSALQVQLYQLSRLVRDREPELHARLEQLDVAPALYAAPWMLTLFTSQFPLGFVVRVFDLIFLDSLDIVFAVSLALLSAHKDGLMLCESCEEAAEYLKHKLPDVDQGMCRRVMKKVHSLDISRQLSEYAVEYAVLREEMPRLATLAEENRRLAAQGEKLAAQLDSAVDAITSYQKTQTKLETQNKQMEQHLTLLSRYISAQRHDMPLEIKKIVQSYSKKLSFSSKILKFTSNEPEVHEEVAEDPKKTFKSGVSAPNLFAKISRDEVMNAMNREKNKVSPEPDKRSTMKKSHSIHTGLVPPINRQYPLKALEENENEYQRSDSFRSDVLKESLKELGKKNGGFFASTHEQIRQERLFEQQLKHDFDENLKKSDEKLGKKSYIDDLSVFQSRKCMSLNITAGKCDKVEEFVTNDSGFVTPMSPNDADKKDDNCSIISHPLSDCDVDIKFDGQVTKLKQIRPFKSSNVEKVYK